ncbi:hypothetical protein BS47DRAFT_1364692 [Hydnum rufescens UP504]|uniref:Uncharacterized protein n=1 Tax=Hydnum rufescens UP504 TaxID=1448309 RepID=A0A9P6AQV5_9AGAM|nr:hypothetical protein BS47DRAFT_1364692 [Hydnum rufescens UP504]
MAGSAGKCKATITVTNNETGSNGDGAAKLKAKQVTPLSKPCTSALPWKSKPAWTWLLVQKLTEDPPFHIALFSDSVTTAKVEDWPVLKNGVAKTILHQELAAYIFEDDSEQKEKYVLKLKEFAKSVGSCLKILHNEYKDLKATLNSTGHGVKPLDVEEGASAKIKKTFPWWDEFHAFWMDLLNYNPIGMINSASATAEQHTDMFKELLAGEQDMGLKVDVGGLLAGDGLDHEDKQENLEIISHPSGP